MAGRTPNKSCWLASGGRSDLPDTRRSRLPAWARQASDRPASKLFGCFDTDRVRCGLFAQLGDNLWFEAIHAYIEMRQLVVRQQHHPTQDPIGAGLFTFPCRARGHSRISFDLFGDCGISSFQVAQEREFVMGASMSSRSLTQSGLDSFALGATGQRVKAKIGYADYLSVKSSKDERPRWRKSSLGATLRAWARWRMFSRPILRSPRSIPPM